MSNRDFKMYRLVLLMIFFVMSCHARVQNSVSSSANEVHELCNHSNVMESLQCFEEKNIELQRLLKQQGNEQKSNYLSWNKQVVQNCEHLKLPSEEIPQGEGLGLIKQQCYYKAYSSRLKVINNIEINSDSRNLSVSAPKTIKEIAVDNGVASTYRTLPLPISSETIDECNAAQTEGRQVAKCKSILPYWLSHKDEDVVKRLLVIAKNSNAPIFEQNFAWLLLTRDGVVYLSLIAEESGDNWFLVSENSSGVSKYIDFGIGSTFNIDKQMKVTVQVAEKRGKKIKHYQIEQDGSVNQLD